MLLKTKFYLPALPDEHITRPVLLERLRTGGALDLARRLRRKLHQRQVTAPRGSDPDAPALTPKERQVLAFLADGLTNAGIANELGVAPSTVKTHLKNIYAKLGVKRRGHAVARARAAGLL